MAQEIVAQKNFNVGEIDPQVDARSDLKVYFAGLALAENLVTTPLGPITRRPGTVFIDTVRHILAPVGPITAPMVLPTGDDPNKLLSADGALFTTTAAMGAGSIVLIEIDFGGPVEVGLIDLVDYAAKDGGGGAAAPAPAPFTFPFTPPGGFTVPTFGDLGQLP